MYAANPIMYVVFTVQAMHRMDILYSNAGCEQFSTKIWNKSFKKLSERLTSEDIFKNIEVDSNGYRFVSKSDDHTISHKQMCSLFLSNDLEKYEEFKKKYLESGQLRFLDGESLDGFKTGFMTFPRSGNTFLRKYIELITGVATGSDMPVENPMPL